MANACPAGFDQLVSSLRNLIQSHTDSVLQRYNERLALAQEAGAVGFFEIDLTTGKSAGTAAFFQIYGLPSNKGAWEAKEWVSFVHSDDRERVTSFFQQAYESGNFSDIEYRIVRRDGAVRWTLARARLRLGQDGKPAVAYGTQQDITDRKLTELALAESEEHHRHFVEANPGIFWVADPDGQITIVHQSGAEWLGVAENLRAADPEAPLIHPDDQDRVSEQWREALKTGEPYRLSHRVRTTSGEYRWLQVQAFARRGPEGEILRWYGVTTDIHDRRVAEEALRLEGERLNLALKGMRGWAYDWDVANDRFWYTEGWEEVLGLESDDGMGTTDNFARLVHPEDQAGVFETVMDHLKGKTPGFDVEYRIRTADGSWRWILDRGRVISRRESDGEPLRAVGIRTDIAERKAQEEIIAWRARHDPLTGLINRTVFYEQLENDLACSRASGQAVGVLIVDLDRFKQVNDTFGHEAGDELLKAVASRLKGVTDGRGSIARLGGDEFALIAPAEHGAKDVGELAKAILETLKRPFRYNGREHDNRASVGYALFPSDADGSGQLLKNADLALYEAKSQGRGCAVGFNAEMREAIDAQVRINHNAKRALGSDAITAYYQPKIDLGDGSTVGFEALLRWHEEEGTLLMPDDIESAFHDRELGAELGQRMLDNVIADMERWQEAGVDFGHVSLNTSEADFRQDNFAERVLRRLASSNIAADKLEIEVTEHIFLGRSAERVQKNLKQFADAGVGISLDDFGTGFASLSHLKSYPVTTIKIDRSFVQDALDDPSDAAIVRALIGLGRSLGKKVVAEGVETSAQADFLEAEGCPQAQGFLYSMPVQSEEVPRLVKTHWLERFQIAS